MQKKTGAPIITLNTVDEAPRFLDKYHTFVLGLFEKFEVYSDIISVEWVLNVKC